MNPRRYKETSVAGAETGVPLTPELIGEFIASIRGKGYVQGTVDRYQASLEQLYHSLSGEKRIGRGTLAACREQMLADGYAARTANLRISAANSLLSYLGLREYQLTDQIKPGDENIPEISRGEYHRLLRTARNTGKERAYLLVKLFASTGLPLQELAKVTVESVPDLPDAGWEADEPDERDDGDASALPGGRGCGGKGEPTLPETAASGHPGGDRGQIPPAG